MAVIHMLWNGIDETVSTPTTNYFRGSTSGYLKPADYSETWTGTGLVYANANSPYPTGGILNSWSIVKNNGHLGFEASGMNFVVPAGASYSGIIGGMVAGKDDWYGGSGNDFFYLSSGGDSYHGGAGIDTVDSLGLSRTLVLGTNLNLKKDAAGGVLANVGLATLTLDSVERIRFSEVSVAVDVDGNGGEAVKLLGAVFGKTAAQDKTYIGIALSLLDGGHSAAETARVALDAKLGSSYQPAELVKVLYTNVFGSAPSATDLQFYANMVSSGAITPEGLTLAAADLPMNADNIGLAGLAVSGIDYLPFTG